jgi:hypothetical protein
MPDLDLALLFAGGLAIGGALVMRLFAGWAGELRSRR